MYKGIGPPGQIKKVGAQYLDIRSGKVWRQNKIPFGNDWTSEDGNSEDDSMGGSAIFTGGTIVGPTSFQSTISSGGTNLNSLFATSAHEHSIGEITNLQSTLNNKSNTSHTHEIAEINNLSSQLSSKAPTSNPIFSDTITFGIKNSTANVNVSGNMSANTIFGNIFRTNIIKVNSDYFVDSGTEEDFSIISTEIPKIIYLPSNPTNGRIIIIINDYNMESNTTTIDANSKTINNSLTFDLVAASRSTTIQFFEGNWYII